MNKILICLGYNYIVVTPEILERIASADSYSKDWEGTKYVYKRNTEQAITNIEIVTTSELEQDLMQVNIKNVMEENNRLTRVNELLQAELDRLKGKSDSTELVVN